MRPRFNLLAIAAFLVIFFANLVSPISAADPENWEDLIDQAGSEKNLKEFCERRIGDQMNLETWYSGKCKTDKDGPLLDSFSGEGVGFSSIVILDLAEKINGKKDPDKSFFDFIIDLKNQVENNTTSMTKEDVGLLMAQKRQEFIIQNNTSILSGVSQGISMLINNPPASTKEYLAYIANNLQKHHIVSDTYAQNLNPGYGYSGLAPFLPIWKAFRDISYILFVLAFVLYGFMMMFRVNISAKTAISVQLALPKLIFTLLIITFSYAIVGFMVDLMYLVFYSILGLLDSQGIIIMDRFFLKMASGQGGMILSFILNSAVAIPASALGVINLVIGGPLIISGLIGAIMFAGGLGMIISLVLFFAIGISYIKLFIKLIQAFIGVIIALVTAPIILLGNVLPGTDTFGTWLRGIVANLSVFPITMLLLLFSYVLMIQPLLQPVDFLGKLTVAYTNYLNQLNLNPCGSSTTAQECFFGVKNLADSSQGIMAVPLISTPVSLNALSSSVGTSIGTSAALLALLGIGLLLMAAKYVDIVKDALKVPPFKYGAAIEDALKYGSKKASEAIPPTGVPHIPLPGRIRRPVEDFNQWSADRIKDYGSKK